MSSIFSVRTLAILALAGLAVASVAHADIIYFSGALSDNDDPNLSHFSARAEYSYSNLDHILTLTLYNDTASPYDYTLSQFNFNTSSDVTGLALIADTNDPLYNAAYPAASSGGSANNGGFGTFDWSFDLGSGNDGIAAGNSATFYFNVTGDFVDQSDFFSHISTKPNGGVAIVHFARGPGDDSVWATPGQTPPPPVTVVPEPASLVLVGMGFLAMGLRRMRVRL